MTHKSGGSIPGQRRLLLPRHHRRRGAQARRKGARARGLPSAHGEGGVEGRGEGRQGRHTPRGGCAPQNRDGASAAAPSAASAAPMGSIDISPRSPSRRLGGMGNVEIDKRSRRGVRERARTRSDCFRGCSCFFGNNCMRRYPHNQKDAPIPHTANTPRREKASIRIRQESGPSDI